MQQPGRAAKSFVIGLIVLITLCSGGGAALGAGQFSVDRQLVEVVVEPGRIVHGSLIVTNHGDDALTLEVLAVDFSMDREGRVSTLGAGSGARSLFPHLNIGPAEITVGPRESRELPYVIQLPEDATGSYWSAVHIRPKVLEPPPTEEVRHEGRTIRINYLVQYRTVFLATATDPGTVGAKIRSIARSRPFDRFNVAVENTGSSIMRGSGWVDIRNDRGQSVKTLPLNEVLILPDHTRIVSSVADPSLGDLAAGEYVALVVFDYGGDALAAGQLTFGVE